jgi:hypothetical protein
LKKDDEGPYYKLKIIGHEERAEKFTEETDLSKKKKVTVRINFISYLSSGPSHRNTFRCTKFLFKSGTRGIIQSGLYGGDSINSIR